ncbi:PH domain-containing protein [Candidatus Saccharibacteria bacterium]|nr:PH domain-containing protein [Candidatus Saccharibacteria bacterium]
MKTQKEYPHLKLEKGEHVEFAFVRAKVCLAMIFGGLALGLVVILFGFLVALMGQKTLDPMGRNFMFTLLAILVGMAFIIALVALIVYRGNKLYVTNKRVVQMVMTSPVVTSVNIIDLPSVEDASFHQSGILQKMFKYGTLRLSTVGDETTYTFNYCDISADDLKKLSRLITGAKETKKQA